MCMIWSKSLILIKLSLISTDRSARHRKVLGGGMRQSGILAAAGLVALDKSMARLHEDHENAQKFAKGRCCICVTVRIT